MGKIVVKVEKALPRTLVKALMNAMKLPGDIACKALSILKKDHVNITNVPASVSELTDTPRTFPTIPDL
jgi:hypothetical protein